MTPEVPPEARAGSRWQRLRELFDELVELPPAAQDLRLGAIALESPELERELRGLLVAERASGTRFERAPELPEDGAPDEPVGPATDHRIGPYRIAREVGRGGMGAVYEAVREDAGFTKRVALKMVPSGRDTEQILGRFRRERRILAGLDHKNIAALLDGGVTADGRPYFAMEFVEGERIDRYCDRAGFGLRERLQLMRQVCAAVHYAHQHLVVHRDLKPSNVLVGPDGTVKLLDFGIAKLLDPVDTDEDLTETGTLPMTTAYASPEQIRGDPVNTATDVYSLGVVLYELLTGRSPFALTGLPLVEMRRRLLEEDPQPPGLDSELEHILLMALRKEPERRYASAEQLSEDLHRYLQGLPIQAQPDSLGYRVRKFVARNRVVVGAVGVVFVALAGALVVTLRQFQAGRRERARAEVVNRFLQDLLTSSPAGVTPGGAGQPQTVRDVLDAAARRLRTEDLDANPGVRATLEQIVGSSYLAQGQYDLAEAHLKAALAAQSRLSGPDSPELLRTLVGLAQLALARADYVAADSIFERRLVILREELRKGTVPPDVYAAALSDFGTLRRARGDSREAERLLQQVLALEPQLPEERRGVIRQAESILALTWLDQGRFEEAERYARELVGKVRASGKGADLDLSSGLTLLGSVLMERGALEEAGASLREAETVYRQVLDSNHTAIYDNLRLQAQVEYLAGRLPEAGATIDRVLRKYRENSSTRYVNYATALTTRGLILRKEGRLPEAEQTLQEALRLRRANLPDRHFMTALTMGALGEVLTAERRFAEAEPLLLGSYQTLLANQAVRNRRVEAAHARLEELYLAWGRPERISAVAGASPLP